MNTMKLSCLFVKRILILLAFSFLSSILFAQNPYDGWDKTEMVLTYQGFSHNDRRDRLIELTDRGYARAMYYATEYGNSNKNTGDILKKSAHKGYFKAEYVLGCQYLWDFENVDSAYYWLNKAIEHTESFVDADLKSYLSAIKETQVEHKLSREYERLTTYSLANAAMSYYYIKKGEKVRGLEKAKKSYEVANKIHLPSKGWKPKMEIYAKMIENCWVAAINNLAAAYFINGETKKAKDFCKKYPFLKWNYSFKETKEPLEYTAAICMQRVYGEKHPLVIEYYKKAAEKKSYYAMLSLLKVKDLSTLDKMVLQDLV